MIRTPAQMEAVFLRAQAKSDEQARAGNLPRLLRQGDHAEDWSVSSRTTAGSIYLLHITRDEFTCSCQSAGWCWHRTHIERAQAGEIGMLMLAGPSWPLPRKDGSPDDLQSGIVHHEGHDQRGAPDPPHTRPGAGAAGDLLHG